MQVNCLSVPLHDSDDLLSVGIFQDLQLWFLFLVQSYLFTLYSQLARGRFDPQEIPLFQIDCISVHTVFSN